MTAGTKAKTVTKYTGDLSTQISDVLAIEEPLEIRIEYGPENDRIIKNLSITMRTPGNDADLVAGFLFTEGMVKSAGDLTEINFPAENVALAGFQPEVEVAVQQLDRHFYTTSSCGVCGKTSIDAIKTTANCSFSKEKIEIIPEIIYGFPGQLRQAQTAFDATGGIHAAAMFDQEGRLLALREDVGRHNALDKLIGHFLQSGQVPLSDHILLLSGRASFELIQKAAMAGIRVVCAVGAPSTLAVETAQEFGICLIGFLRDGRFNRYC